jgi:hypothetical protein
MYNKDEHAHKMIDLYHPAIPIKSNRGGSGFLLHKTQSPSPRVGLRPKPNFFTYVVKPEPEPEPDKSPTYLVNFSSIEKAQAQSMKPEPDQSPKKSGPTHL